MTDDLYDAALPKDAPGAWIREAIEAQRAADEWPPEAEAASEEIADTFGRPWINDYRDPGHSEG